MRGTGPTLPRKRSRVGLSVSLYERARPAAQSSRAVDQRLYRANRCVRRAAEERAIGEARAPKRSSCACCFVQAEVQAGPGYGWVASERHVMRPGAYVVQ